MPHPGGDIGTEVTVAVGILDHPGTQLDRPRAVGTLNLPTPLERRAGRPEQSRSGERPPHAVPRVASETSALTWAPSGLTKYIATLLPTSGFSTASAARVILGRRIRSHTSIL